MILMPDLDAVYTDPFSATPMLIVFCDVVEPATGEGYSRDPRTTAKRAEAYLGATGIGDTVYVGRSEEHTSELQSLMRISYAVFCLKKKKKKHTRKTRTRQNNIYTILEYIKKD